MTSMALSLGAVGLLWQAYPDIILFLNCCRCHPASLLVGSVIWTYTPEHWSCFLWHLPLCPSLVLASFCFPCGYDGTANLQ